MLFCGQEPIKSKIAIKNNIIQQINIFKYIKYVHIKLKVPVCFRVTGLIRKTFKQSKLRNN